MVLATVVVADDEEAGGGDENYDFASAYFDVASYWTRCSWVDASAAIVLVSCLVSCLD